MNTVFLSLYDMIRLDLPGDSDREAKAAMMIDGTTRLEYAVMGLLASRGLDLTRPIARADESTGHLFSGYLFWNVE